MQPGSAITRVESGLLAGGWSEGHAVRTFMGVPYARPPLGALRWRPPQPAERWDGMRPAQAFRPRCIQPDRPETAVGYFGPEPESEDCLYLNIWTPAQPRSEQYPVMVWFHGGAFLVGSGALPIFRGDRLARHGVVVVTVNYRLGRLGFLAHPDLSREQPYRASGNYGHLDQIAALRWIQANIAAFGGDPACVTIFGQSAGASSVSTLMASPLTKGLFHRAIGQSGGAFGARILAPLETAEKAGLAFARAIGAPSVEDLRARPARELQLVRPQDDGAMMERYDSNDAKGIDRPTSWPVIDGYLLPSRVADIFARGEQNDVPLLTGATADEGSTQPAIPSSAEFVRRARADYGDLADELLRLFPAGSDSEAEASSRRVIGTKVFNWENWTWASAQARTGKSGVHFYHFSRVPPKPLSGGSGDKSRHIGAFHTAEIPYVFQTLDARSWPWQERDRELADLMTGYWTRFASSGDPNSPGLPYWPRWDPAQPTTMIIGDDMRVGPVPDLATLAFWQAYNDKLRSDDAA
jgi:para-nitrobenzyl esterase